jgi:hypothetical protein
MKKILLITFFVLVDAGIVFAAPYYRQEATILPISDNAYDLGTSTKAWRDIFTNRLIVSTTTSGCAQFSANGIIYSTGSACGTGIGGGSSGGTWSTTTSTVTGRLINYPNNNTDIVVIGANATTSAEFWLDPNVPTSFFTGNMIVDLTSVNNNEVLSLRNNAGWTTGKYNNIAWRDNQNIAGAIGMNYNSGTASVDFTVNSLYNNSAYQNTSYVPFIVKGNGNVGIGTSTPYTRLSIAGETVAANFTATSTTANSTFAGNVGISSSTPWAQLAINPIAGQAMNKFAIGSSTATSFLVTNKGNVAIGTSNPDPTATFDIVDGTGTNTIFQATVSNIANWPVFFFRRSRGTPTAPTAVANTDVIASMDWYGHTGTAYIPVTQIRSTVDGGTVGASRISSNLTFSTHPDSTTAMAEAMRINSSGYVGIGTTSPWRTLSVTGSSDLGNNAYAGYFTATTSTASSFPYASTTMISATTASTSNFYGASLVTCQSGNVLTWATGQFGCAADQTGGGGGTFAWTPTTNFAQDANSTTTQIWLRGTPISLSASSTAQFVYASSTAVSGQSVCIGTDCRTSWPTGGSISGGTAGMLAAWTSSSALTATGTPTFDAFTATSTIATSTVAGSLAIGTSTANSMLEVNGGFHIEEQVLTTSTSMTIDFCSKNTSNRLRMGVGTSNITVTFTNANLCPGKGIVLTNYAPLSGLIGSTTFSGGSGSGNVIWNGNVNPGNSVVNASTDRFLFISTATTTSYIAADLTGTF